MTKKEKIEFHAVYTKRNTIMVCDQHGREIDGVPDTIRSYGEQRVITKVELEAPMFPTDKPHVTISVRVPLEVQERMPEWMQDFIKERYGD